MESRQANQSATWAPPRARLCRPACLCLSASWCTAPVRHVTAVAVAAQAAPSGANTVPLGAEADGEGKKGKKKKKGKEAGPEEGEWLN